MNRIVKEGKIRSFFLILSACLTLLVSTFFLQEFLYLWTRPFWLAQHSLALSGQNLRAHGFIFTEVTEAIWIEVSLAFLTTTLCLAPLFFYQGLSFFSPSWLNSKWFFYWKIGLGLCVTTYGFILLSFILLLPKICLFFLQFEYHTSFFSLPFTPTEALQTTSLTSMAGLGALGKQTLSLPSDKNVSSSVVCLSFEPRISPFLSFLWTFLFLEILCWFCFVGVNLWLEFYSIDLQKVKTRSLAWLISLFLAALVSPPEICFQVSFTLCFGLLYEFLFLFRLYRQLCIKKKKKLAVPQGLKSLRLTRL
jgi:Sec-independent protein secretion pathway component TatC